MAAIFDCSVDTLRRNYRKELDDGLEMAKASLRRAQFKAAMKGNATMLIFLGKQYLGQSDNPNATPEETAVNIAKQIRIALNRMEKGTMPEPEG